MIVAGYQVSLGKAEGLNIFRSNLQGQAQKIGPRPQQPLVIQGWLSAIVQGVNNSYIKRYSFSILSIDQAMRVTTSPLLERFAARAIEEADLTDEHVVDVVGGRFNEGYEFPNGFRPGRVSLGMGHGLSTDRMIERWHGAGRDKVVFERRNRLGRVKSQVLWVKMKSAEEEIAEWENKGDLDLARFWLGEIRRHVVKDSNEGFQLATGRFGENLEFYDGFKPGRVAMGVGHILDGETLALEWHGTGKDKIIFERLDADGKVIAKVLWVKLKTKKGEPPQWENKGDFELARFWLGEINRIEITSTIATELYQGRFNAGFRFDGNGYLAGQEYMGIGHGEPGDRIFMDWIGTRRNRVQISRERRSEVIITAEWFTIRQHNAKDLDEWNRDQAQISETAIFTKGGIDLTADKTPLQIQNIEEGIHFKFDPAMIQKFQNARGFYPVIVNIIPLQDVREFLGAL